MRSLSFLVLLKWLLDAGPALLVGGSVKTLLFALLAKPLIGMGGLGIAYAVPLAQVHAVEARAMNEARQAELEAKMRQIEAQEKAARLAEEAAEAEAPAPEEAPEQEP